MIKWIPGRQGSSYDKMPLFVSKLLKCDLYLLRFPCGAEVPKHKDEVQGGQHYRLNIVLRRPKKGGRFICKDKIFSNGRIQFFRPDIHEHSLTRVLEGRVLMLSFGFVRS